MTDSAEVRSRLIEALQIDLVGCADREEILPQAPSGWYLTGFLVPYDTPIHLKSDDTADDELDQVNRTGAGDDESNPETAAARRGFFPSSMGLSFLISQDTKEVTLTVEWGDYCPVAEEETEQAETPLQNRTSKAWQRLPQKREIKISLKSDRQQNINIPDSNGLYLAIATRPVNCKTLPDSTRSVSIFLVNSRKNAVDPERDSAYIFQACLTVQSPQPFVPRPNLRGQEGNDWDESVADLQYRDDCEYAVGHNVSAIALLNPDGSCQQIQTAWIPTADVEKVVPSPVPDVELSMEAIASAKDGSAVREAIGKIVTAYTDWIASQRAKAPQNPKKRADIARDLLNRATVAKDRIEAGLRSLDDPQVFEAFKIANRAIATAIRQRLVQGTDKKPEDLPPPKWRPFQLAFLLMNLVGIAEPTHRDREIVDLLFFPTGGGKTEAYLGLAAFTLVLRRLRNCPPSPPNLGGESDVFAQTSFAPRNRGVGGQGAGVSVIMRIPCACLH